MEFWSQNRVFLGSWCKLSPKVAAVLHFPWGVCGCLTVILWCGHIDRVIAWFHFGKTVNFCSQILNGAKLPSILLLKQNELFIIFLKYSFNFKAILALQKSYKDSSYSCVGMPGTQMPLLGTPDIMVCMSQLRNQHWYIAIGTQPICTLYLRFTHFPLVSVSWSGTSSRLHSVTMSP